MKHKQKAISKILALLVAFLPLFASAQHPARLAREADSLFQAKQYTQSLERYKEILKKHEYSEAMLLKMAFIQEGLGQTSEALYYLSLYHQASNDAMALAKIEELANQHHLQGYAPSQSKQLALLFKKYSGALAKILAGCCILLVGLLAYLKRKGRNVMPTAISVLALLALLFYLVNFGEAAPSGIVHHNSTYLMSGPSAGASVVAIVDEGHMLGVLGKKDVWVHTRWMGQDVYVKENQLLMVGL